jgi:hypothetical protein
MRGAAVGAVTSVLLALSFSFNAAAASAAAPCKRNCTDTTAPRVAVASPASGATVVGTITVSGSASDNVALARVDVAVDGAFKTATGTASWSLGVDTRSYANGTHTLTARATDTSGNTASTSVTVTVANTVADTTPPTVAIASPAGGSSVSGSVGVSGTASDATAVARVDVAVDGGAWSTAGGTTAWSWTWSASGATNGTHTLTARAVDTAGNASTSAVTVSVANAADSTAPTVSVSAPAAGASVAGTVSVSGTASDDTSVASVRIAVDGGAWKTATGTTNWSWSWDTTAAANGGHTLAVQAVDSTGNVSAPANVSVTVANSPAPGSTCSDGAAVLSQTVTPEGVRIMVCTTVGGWTTSSIYDLLKPNAVDLAVVGPHLTVQVETGNPSTEGSSASCCDAGGNYYGYGAVIVVNPNSNSSFSAAPDALMAHEYGHAWTYYWLYMNPANHGSWAAYDNFRWANAGGTQVLAQSPSLNTSYSWMDYEMAADDYRRLFGTAAAQSELSFLNSGVPDSQQVTGLATFFLNTWR